MSLQTWKEEFYPIPADKVEEKDAVQHSLTKWKGLLPENLKKHEVFRIELCSSPTIVDQYTDISEISVGLPVTSKSCSLCELYFATKAAPGCTHCPIKVSSGESCNKEYWTYREEGNPTPMIELLERTLLHSQKGNNGE